MTPRKAVKLHRELVGFNFFFMESNIYVCWLVFVNLTETRVIWEEDTSIRELDPSDWTLEMLVGCFFND